MSSLLYETESYSIRGAIYDVWRQFGGAFKESVVDKALAITLKKKGLEVKSQIGIPIYYEGEKIGLYRPDQIINDIILIELKAKAVLTEEDKKQFWYYLKGSKYRLGFLVNFGSRLEIIRRVYDTAKDKQWMNQRASA